MPAFDNRTARPRPCEHWGNEIMWAIIAIILVVCWIFGFLLFHVTSFLIHVLLLVALVALLYHFVKGRRGAP
jgi:hypothetical protein